MVNVRNNGMPLIEQAPKASITQSIVSLASELSAAGNDEETVDKKNGWLGFLSGKAKAKS